MFYSVIRSFLFLTYLFSPYFSPFYFRSSRFLFSFLLFFSQQSHPHFFRPHPAFLLPVQSIPPSIVISSCLWSIHGFFLSALELFSDSSFSNVFYRFDRLVLPIYIPRPLLAFQTTPIILIYSNSHSAVSPPNFYILPYKENLHLFPTVAAQTSITTRTTAHQHLSCKCFFWWWWRWLLCSSAAEVAGVALLTTKCHQPTTKLGRKPLRVIVDGTRSCWAEFPKIVGIIPLEHLWINPFIPRHFHV